MLAGRRTGCDGGRALAIHLHFDWTLKVVAFVSQVFSWTRSCVVSGNTVIRCFEVSTSYLICISTNRIYTSVGFSPRRNSRVMFLGSVVFSRGILLILFPKHDELFPPFRPPSPMFSPTNPDSLAQTSKGLHELCWGRLVLGRAGLLLQGARRTLNCSRGEWKVLCCVGSLFSFLSFTFPCFLTPSSDPNIVYVS